MIMYLLSYKIYRFPLIHPIKIKKNFKTEKIKKKKIKIEVKRTSKKQQIKRTKTYYININK
jgi:hypothetical protein